MADTQILPDTIISKADVTRLQKQVAELDDKLHQHRLKNNDELPNLPVLPAAVTLTVEAFGIEINADEHRAKFLKQLEGILANSPVIHISFAVTPKPAFMQKITHWFRTEVHPTALIQVGLQPSIAAGCIVRTPNKQFDFSLRQFLQTKQDLLVQSVRGEQ